MAGMQINKAQLDGTLGGLAVQFKQLMERVGDVAGYLALNDDATLTALGYSSAEIAVVRAAVADMAQLAQIGQGQQALATQKDFTANVRQLWGLGF